MARYILIILLFLFYSSTTQSQKIDKRHFFEDTSIIHGKITGDLISLFKNYKNKGYTSPAFFSCNLADGTKIEDSVELEIRGNFRRQYCYIPPLKINFRYDSTCILSPLKTLKLVTKCKLITDDDQYVLIEYMAYKIYNLLTDTSFRVRLMELKLDDTKGSKKDIDAYAFLIEDAKDMSKRNHCKEKKQGKFPQDKVDRRQITLLSVFQYMIGNTDWSTHNRHNIYLIADRENPNSAPLPIPYDFDFSGMVGTTYSTPSEDLGIDDVRQRLYRGLPRTKEEINDILDLFKQNEKAIFDMINNFDLFTPLTRKSVIKYLEPFFNTIKDSKKAEAIFVENARKN